MPKLELTHLHASYVTDDDGVILIRSPITWDKQMKSHIGINLQGLLKPNERMTIKFHPHTNVLADYLRWTADGVILYLIFPQSATITCGQTLGTLTLHEYSLFAFLKQSNVAKFKRCNYKIAKTNIT